MTELEKMLRDTLTRLEQGFSRSLSEQGEEVQEQRRLLDAHSRSLQQLQEEATRTKADLQALTRRLEDLAGLSVNLEPLVSRLNGILNGK
ncbi:hypothetical protein FACS1894168_0290 [Deltaproteobacteria bacterium]|nr:hypothetical protein FACS1894168_0290 [Deltaproteobacteria bacterium]